MAREKDGIKAGINIACGEVTYQGVADAYGLPYTPVDAVMHPSSLGAQCLAAS